MNNNQEDERFASLVSKRLSETTRHELLNFAQGKQPKTFDAFSWRTSYFLTGGQLLARWKMLILRAVLFAAFLIIAWLCWMLA